MIAMACPRCGTEDDCRTGLCARCADADDQRNDNALIRLQGDHLTTSTREVLT